MNDHLRIDPSAEPPVHADGEGYLAYFMSESGPMLFYQAEGAATATLRHGDAEWRAYEIRDPARTGMVLNALELQWLLLCWEASRPWRATPSPFEDQG